MWGLSFLSCRHLMCTDGRIFSELLTHQAPRCEDFPLRWAQTSHTQNCENFNLLWAADTLSPVSCELQTPHALSSEGVPLIWAADSWCSEEWGLHSSVSCRYLKRWRMRFYLCVELQIPHILKSEDLPLLWAADTPCIEEWGLAFYFELQTSLGLRSEDLPLLWTADIHHMHPGAGCCQVWATDSPRCLNLTSICR